MGNVLDEYDARVRVIEVDDTLTDEQRRIRLMSHSATHPVCIDHELALAMGLAGRMDGRRHRGSRSLMEYIHGMKPYG